MTQSTTCCYRGRRHPVRTHQETGCPWCPRGRDASADSFDIHGNGRGCCAHVRNLRPRTPMADDSNEDEVVLYRVRHGSSSYIVLPAEAGAVPGHEMLERTRSQVDEEHAGFLRDRVAEDDDIRDLFHSGRAVKHRLPSFMKTGEELPIRSEGLSTAQAQALLGKFGRNEIGEPTKPDWKLFVEQFTAPMPIGLWIAIVIELALQNWIDACILFALQMTNGIVAFTEAKKAGDAIAALKGSLKPTAQAKRDGRFQEVDAGELVPGDLILLRQGAAVPADCIVQSRSLHVDQSVITGESHPVAIPEGEQARMGSTVTRGEAEATVFKTGKNTFYGKTATLLQATGNELGELRKMLFFVVLVLLAFSGVLCVICLAFLLGNHMNLQSSIEFVVVLMVASIPVAMEVVVTATLALGSRQLSSHSAIVPNLSAIERLSGMDILCSDKTGTLTLNKMVIQHECPAFVPNVNRDDVLLYATLAVKWNLPPKDAIDTMILSAADLDRCNAFEQIDYVPFDASIKRTEATIRDQHGHVFQVAKGAPHTLLDMCPDKGRIQNAVESSVYDLAARGVRSLAVAKTDVNGDWHMQGLLAFLDPPRPDSRDTIKLANQYGVAVKMITGDHQLIAVETAKAMELGHANILPCKEGVLPTIDLSGEKVQVPKTLGRDYAAMILSKDGFSTALPEHKFLIVEALKQAGWIVGMTGDGVNDAPALKAASVGIAVSGATDAARAASDIVLTKPGLNAIIHAMLIARQIFARMNAFLTYRIAATLQLVVFFFISILVLRPQAYHPEFPQFWTMPVIALIIITVLNDGTMVTIAYDRATASNRPQSWVAVKLWGLAIIIAAVACVSSVLMLYFALDSWRPGSLFSMMNMSPLTFEDVVVALYLKISISDYLSIFAARTGAEPFYTSLPGVPLALAAVLALSLSTIFSATWPFGIGGSPLGWQPIVFVWVFSIVVFLIQDLTKVVICKAALRVASRMHIAPTAVEMEDIQVQQGG